jgi:hypothetical protein
MPCVQFLGCTVGAYGDTRTHGCGRFLRAPGKLKSTPTKYRGSLTVCQKAREYQFHVAKQTSLSLHFSCSGHEVQTLSLKLL